MPSSDWIMNLPAVNAALNGTATILLLLGGIAIKKFKNESLHRSAMVAAFGVSTLFLLFYLIYHYNVGHVTFEGVGLIRVVYFVLLIPHIILAVVQVPLILLTMLAAIKGNRTRHVKLARWTFPIWLYVSVTGVIVYYMVFQIDPT